MPRRRRSTRPGQHRPVLLDEVLSVLQPRPEMVVADCTLGWGGHAAALLERTGSSGRLIGLDLDAGNIAAAQQRLSAVAGANFSLHHANFAALPGILAAEGITGVDGVLADLGMSSMQVDDPERGFSYRRDGPLDMRMDRTRGRTAAQLLASLPEAELARALRELGDEPDAERVAALIVARRQERPLERTSELADLLMEASREPGSRPWRLRPAPGRWDLHPAARTFQALRILVNRELANLDELLRVLPEVLRPGGTAALISFHSGEDRRVKAAFRDGQHRGLYAAVADEPIRPGPHERTANPRARSARLRWARR
jgi:16S rRNA (cytosine1402-N4)-methyltransferase